MSDLQSAVDEAIALLKDEANQEFALFYIGEKEWKVHAVSGCTAVYLGETEGKYQADGESALEAVTKLIKVLEEWRE